MHNFCRFRIPKTERFGNAADKELHVKGASTDMKAPMNAITYTTVTSVTRGDSSKPLMHWDYLCIFEEAMNINCCEVNEQIINAALPYDKYNLNSV